MITLITIVVLLCMRLVYNRYKHEFHSVRKFIQEILFFVYLLCVITLTVVGVGICLFGLCLLIKAIIIYLP